MDATCTIQDSIHVFSLVHKYVSRILGTYQLMVVVAAVFYYLFCSSNSFFNLAISASFSSDDDFSSSFCAFSSSF